MSTYNLVTAGEDPQNAMLFIFHRMPVNPLSKHYGIASNVISKKGGVKS